jgi:hypothetical protein
MTRPLRIAAALVVGHFLTWTTCFAAMFLLRGEAVPWDLYLTYLTMAWTFRGGEIPMFIWWSSVIVFVPIAMLVFITTSRARHAD